MKAKILIVIPALNEEETIEKVIINSKCYGDVLVVDDGSTDDTSTLAKKAGAVVIGNNNNFGYEHALNLGHSYACRYNYQIMITMDADGQLPHHKIPSFIKTIKKGAAVVIGKRNVIPRFTEKLLANFSSLIYGIDDPFCGMKAYDLNANPQTYFSHYNSIGTSFILDYASLKLPIINIKIKIKERKGKSKFGGKFKSELRLAPSVFFGIIRLFFIWFSNLNIRTKK